MTTTGGVFWNLHWLLCASDWFGGEVGFWNSEGSSLLKQWNNKYTVYIQTIDGTASCRHILQLFLPTNDIKPCWAKERFGPWSQRWSAHMMCATSISEVWACKNSNKGSAGQCLHRFFFTQIVVCGHYSPFLRAHLIYVCNLTTGRMLRKNHFQPIQLPRFRYMIGKEPAMDHHLKLKDWFGNCFSITLIDIPHDFQFLALVSEAMPFKLSAKDRRNLHQVKQSMVKSIPSMFVSAAQCAHSAWVYRYKSWAVNRIKKDYIHSFFPRLNYHTVLLRFNFDGFRWMLVGCIEQLLWLQKHGQQWVVGTHLYINDLYIHNHFHKGNKTYATPDASNLFGFISFGFSYPVSA